MLDSITYLKSYTYSFVVVWLSALKKKNQNFFVFKEIGLHAQNLLSILKLIVKIIVGTYMTI